MLSQLPYKTYTKRCKIHKGGNLTGEDLNGDRRTDYYSYGEYANRLRDVTDEISPTKKGKSISFNLLWIGIGVTLVGIFIFLISKGRLI